jgi:hypothetical protein
MELLKEYIELQHPSCLDIPGWNSANIGTISLIDGNQTKNFTGHIVELEIHRDHQPIYEIIGSVEPIGFIRGEVTRTATRIEFLLHSNEEIDSFYSILWPCDIQIDNKRFISSRLLHYDAEMISDQAVRISAMIRCEKMSLEK